MNINLHANYFPHMIAYTLLGIVAHNHRYGCQKCTVTGVYSKHTMSYEDLGADLRTDKNFRDREQPEHHHEDSVLEYLDIDMIKSFSIADSLHLLELGILLNL